MDQLGSLCGNRRGSSLSSRPSSIDNESSTWNTIQHKIEHWGSTFYTACTTPSLIPEKKKLHYEIVDLYKTVEEDPFATTLIPPTEHKGFTSRFIGYILREHTWILLSLIGICSAMMAILLEFSVTSLILGNQSSQMLY
jgi:hypothetical protein